MKKTTPEKYGLTCYSVKLKMCHKEVVVVAYRSFSFLSMRYVIVIFSEVRCWVLFCVSFGRKFAQSVQGKPVEIKPNSAKNTEIVRFDWNSIPSNMYFGYARKIRVAFGDLNPK